MSSLGRRHALLVCANVGAPGDCRDPFARANAEIGAGPPASFDDFPALVDHAEVARVAVTSAGGRSAAVAGPEERDRAADGGRVLVGRLVHRLFQHEVRGDDGLSALAARAGRMVTDDEREMVDRIEPVAAEAARVFARMWAQPGVRAVLEGATCHYEVPVAIDAPAGTHGAGPAILRGVIDCLAMRPDGSVVVLDFKTGTPRDADHVQLETYVEAARAVCPGAPVEGRLVYPRPPAGGRRRRR